MENLKTFEEFKWFKKKRKNEPEQYLPGPAVSIPIGRGDRIVEEYYSDNNKGIEIGDTVVLTDKFIDYCIDFEYRGGLDEKHRQFTVENISQNKNFGYVADIRVDYGSNNIEDPIYKQRQREQEFVWTVPIICITTHENLKNNKELHDDIDPYGEEKWGDGDYSKYGGEIPRGIGISDGGPGGPRKRRNRGGWTGSAGPG